MEARAGTRARLGVQESVPALRAVTTSDTLGSEEVEGATALDALMSGSL
jgi:hypothetical protein